VLGASPNAYPGVHFDGLGLLTNHPFNLAYKAAEAFTAALQQRTKVAEFMKSMLLQRICSIFASGRSTAAKMLARELSRVTSKPASQGRFKTSHLSEAGMERV